MSYSATMLTICALALVGLLILVALILIILWRNKMAEKRLAKELEDLLSPPPDGKLPPSCVEKATKYRDLLYEQVEEFGKRVVLGKLDACIKAITPDTDSGTKK